MKHLLIPLIILSSLGIKAQTIIKGSVIDQDKNPITGANVFIQGTYDVATTDGNGNFILKAKQTGTKKLSAKFLGFSEYSKEIELNGTSLECQIVLIEKPNELNSVIVQAGAFGASDSKKAVRLNSIDILTTASSVGDVYGALQTLPGTAPVGEDGGLFVRGGEGRETKTFMDGMLVHKPFTSNLPDLPSRGRFMPMMFSGTMFSTGGYSAEYGQAMSSALILTSNGIAEEPVTSIILLPIGANINKTIKNTNSSLSVTADFYNLASYNSVVKPNVEWKHDPSSVNGSYMYRYQLKSGQLIKSFSKYSRSRASLFKNNIDDITTKDEIGLTNDDFYTNTTIFGKLNSDWSYKAGIAYTYDRELIAYNLQDISSIENHLQLKSTFSGNLNEKLRLNTGTEIWIKDYNFDYNNKTANTFYRTHVKNYIPAVFAEAEYFFSRKLSIRIGGRCEYTSLINNVSFSPRLSLAFQTGKFSQVSLATGVFYQEPENEYLRFNQRLDNEKASHYIINYQYIKNEATFRIEAYYKRYSNLVKYDSLNTPNPLAYYNSGNGFARGIDVFFRLNKGIDKNDWWISGSWLDTKRNYKDYPETARPSYFPEFSLSTTYKRMIVPIKTILGFTLITTSRRNYHNPNKIGFMNDKTGFYKDLSISLSYLTKIFKQETVLHMSVSNVFGFENIYGYNFSSRPDEQGLFRSEPITSEAKRMFMLVLMISIK